MQRGIPILGLVGGIGSGKSALADWLAQRLRVVVLDADASGHAALRQPEVQFAIRRDFGDDVFNPTGDVERSRLAQRVFGDTPALQTARQQLEAIVHPVIRRDLEQQIAELRERQACDVIVLDAAVMLESGWSELCDAIAFVDVPRSERLARVLATRGWPESELNRREASQWPLDRKRAAADIVIDNSSDLESAGLVLAKFLRSRFPQLNAESVLMFAATTAVAAAIL